MSSSINFFQAIMQVLWLIIPVIIIVAGFIANNKGQTSAGTLLILGGLIRMGTALFYTLNTLTNLSFMNVTFFNILNGVGFIGGLMMGIGTLLLARSFVIPVKNYSQSRY